MNNLILIENKVYTFLVLVLTDIFKRILNFQLKQKPNKLISFVFCCLFVCIYIKETCMFEYIYLISK